MFFAIYLLQNGGFKPVKAAVKIRFGGRVYSVKGIQGILVGQKVLVAKNPWEVNGARVATYDAEGNEVWVSVPEVVFDEMGFRADAAVIGAEYKAPADTDAQQHRKELDKLAMGAETLEAAAAKRKGKAVPFGGEIAPYKHQEDTLAARNTLYMPKQGQQMAYNRMEVSEQVLSKVEIAKRLKPRVEADGGDWKPAKCEVLNDIDGQLINLYRVIQHHFDEFVRQFDWTLTSREVFARLQSVPPESMTDIQRAARFFYLQHTAFGGKTVHQHFGTTTTSKAWYASQIRAKLTAARNRLSGVFIENEPWERCFKRYDREHTFFYADPPYWQTAGYDRAFDWAQYQLLAKVMSESKGKIMLSINDHPDIRNLFKDFHIAQFELAYSIGRSKTGKTSGELAICNW